MGLFFYEASRVCHSAKGQVALLQQQSMFDLVTTNMSRQECLAKLMAQTLNTRALRETDANHNDKVIKTCQLTEDSSMTDKTPAATSSCMETRLST